MNRQPAFIGYIASTLALAVAVGLLIGGKIAPAAVLAALAAFLIYWTQREDSGRGDR